MRSVNMHLRGTANRHGKHFTISTYIETSNWRQNPKPHDKDIYFGV